MLSEFDAFTSLTSITAPGTADSFGVVPRCSERQGEGTRTSTRAARQTAAGRGNCAGNGNCYRQERKRTVLGEDNGQGLSHRAGTGIAWALSPWTDRLGCRATQSVPRGSDLITIVRRNLRSRERRRPVRRPGGGVEVTGDGRVRRRPASRGLVADETSSACHTSLGGDRLWRPPATSVDGRG